MSYTQSKFNFTYKRNPNENIIYNTFSKALVVLEDDMYRQYETLSFVDADDKNQLVDNGILVEKTFDEMSFLKYVHYKTKFSTDILYLTIAPTLDCNFACPYCYENRRPGKMSAEVQEALISFIRESISQGVNKLHVTWYGGEPLLCLDVVGSISRKIVSLVEEKNCLLKMHLVTNGYLLTQNTIELLDEIGVTRVQVTLDGLKANHDVRRPLKSGGDTFERIIENLALFYDSPIEVLVRMNVDNQNCIDFKCLKEKIDSLGNSNMKAYASPVEDLNKDAVNHVSDFMTTDEFESFAMSACEENGLPADEFAVMDDRYAFCTSETENCYVVDDLGDFYKCWDEVGREEYRCFNILDPENKNYSIISKYLTSDPFSDERCKSCVFLPLCFGGCKYQKAHLAKSVCGFTRATLEKYLEIAFFRGQ